MSMPYFHIGICSLVTRKGEIVACVNCDSREMQSCQCAWLLLCKRDNVTKPSEDRKSVSEASGEDEL